MRYKDEGKINQAETINNESRGGARSLVRTMDDKSRGKAKQTEE